MSVWSHVAGGSNRWTRSIRWPLQRLERNIGHRRADRLHRDRHGSLALAQRSRKFGNEVAYFHGDSSRAASRSHGSTAAPPVTINFDGSKWVDREAAT